MIRREDDGIWVELRETIAVHPEKVIECLTSAGGLTTWFPVAARIEPRTGGEIVLGWDKDFHHKTTIAIIEHNPEGTFIWDWHAAHHDTHAPVYWHIDSDVEEGTKITLRQGPFREDTESLIAMADEAESWRWQLCNLRSVLEVSHDMRRVRPL